MYRKIVTSIIKSNFNHLSTGNYHALLDTVSDNVEHSFLGSSAIGGKRYSKPKLEKWFERVFRLFPSIIFTTHAILVTGWPWHTQVAVEWSANVTPKVGTEYINTGIHLITLKWGKAVQISAYENAELVANACQTMIDAGIEEAGFEQIS